MSFETWCEEFYPIEAKEVSREDALAHSLRKWEGLRPEALAWHGMRLSERYLKDELGRARLAIDNESCALCTHYIAKHCEGCPLEKAGYGCENTNSPWRSFATEGKVEPIIAVLAKLTGDEIQAKNHLPKMKPPRHLIKMGGDYETREGKEVRVLCTDARDDYPVVALEVAEGHVRRYTADGHYLSRDRHSSLDLRPWMPKEVDELMEVSEDGREWYKRYFTGEVKDGKLRAFDDGATSKTGKYSSFWAYWRRPR